MDSGGTGFLGKLTIEKILRSCPDVSKVYMLIRAKKGLTVDERKKSILNTTVFDRMKSEQPDSVDKIVFVPGDCSAPRLGLSDSDYHDLTQHVNIVLHLAATVRFDETLRQAINVNVKGAQEVISLCNSCVHIKAAVFVSTAFSNCPHRIIKEEFYEPPMTVNNIYDVLNKFTERELIIMSQKIIRPWPNTYAFSKAVYENVIKTEAGDLPVVVVRPSIVVSTLKEPIAGWLDNMYGPVSIVVGAGVGIVRVGYSYGEVVLDMVPGDHVANCIITSALTANTRSQDGIPVYNVTASENPVTLRKFTKTLLDMNREFPFKQSLWYPFYYIIGNFYVYKILSFFLHFLPGCLLDLMLRFQGKPQILLKLYRKINKHLLLTTYFSSQTWVFVCENTNKLFENLSTQDKQLFPFDIKVVNWEAYITETGIEIRKYLLNESMDDLDVARSRNKKLYVAHTLVKIILWILVACFAAKIIRITL